MKQWLLDGRLEQSISFRISFSSHETSTPSSYSPLSKRFMSLATIPGGRSNLTVYVAGIDSFNMASHLFD